MLLPPNHSLIPLPPLVPYTLKPLSFGPPPALGPPPSPKTCRSLMGLLAKGPPFSSSMRMRCSIFILFRGPEPSRSAEEQTNDAPNTQAICRPEAHIAHLSCGAGTAAQLTHKQAIRIGSIGTAFTHPLVPNPNDAAPLLHRSPLCIPSYSKLMCQQLSNSPTMKLLTTSLT